MYLCCLSADDAVDCTHCINTVSKQQPEIVLCLYSPHCAENWTSVVSGCHQYGKGHKVTLSCASDHLKKKDLCLSSAHLISHAFTNCYMCTVAAGQQQPAMIQSFKYLSDPYLSLQKIWKCAHSRLDILPYFGLC